MYRTTIRSELIQRIKESGAHERPFPRTALDVPLWFSLSEAQRLTTVYDHEKLWQSKKAYDDYWAAAVAYTGIAAAHTAHMAYAISFARYRRGVEMGLLPPPPAGQNWDASPVAFAMAQQVLNELYAASQHFGQVMVDPVAHPASPSIVAPPPGHGLADDFDPDCYAYPARPPCSPNDEEYSDDMESTGPEPVDDRDLHEILDTLVAPPPLPEITHWNFDDDSDSAPF